MIFFVLSISRSQSQRSRSRGTDSGHYPGSRRGEDVVETSRSPKEYHTYNKKRRKRSDDDGKSGERSRQSYSGRSSRRDHDSDGDVPNDRDMERHRHRHAKGSSKWHGVSESKGDYENTKSKARKPVSDWDRSDSDVDREERPDRSHRHPKSHKKVKREGSRERTHRIDSPIDNSDGNSYHGHRRRRSRSSQPNSGNCSDQNIDLHDRWDPGEE